MNLGVLEMLGKRSRTSKLKQRLYSALAPSEKNPGVIAQSWYAGGDGNAAAEYLYGTLMGYEEGKDFYAVEFESDTDWVICDHIMKLQGLAGRLDDLVALGATWEIVGTHWHQLRAISSLEDAYYEGEDGEDSEGILQASITALLLTLERPVGGSRLARLIREQHPQHSADGWIVKEVTNEIVTMTSLIEHEGESRGQTAVRLPNGTLGVVMYKFGVHPEFIVVKDMGTE